MKQAPVIEYQGRLYIKVAESLTAGQELYSVSYTYDAVSSGQYTEKYGVCEFNIEEKMPVNIRKKLPRRD